MTKKRWTAWKNPLDTGENSDAKIIKVHLYPDEGVDELYILSKRQAAALLNLTTYLEWKTRYYSLPVDFIEDSDAFQAWNDQTKKRLMLPIEICAEIINCINTDTDTQEAFNTFFANYLLNNGYESAGKPRTTTQNNTGLQANSNPTCSLGVVWSQSLMLVRTTDGIVRDLLEKFETLTNPTELLAAAIDAVPLVGDIPAALPEMISILQNFLAENYNADYTTTPITGYEDVLACEYFCLAKLDCNFTIDGIYNIYLQRINTRFSTGTPVLNTLNELSAFILGIDTDGEFIADLCHFLVWGALKLANFIFGGLVNRPTIGSDVLTVWLVLAADTPSNDYLTICTECPAFENIVYESNPIQSGLVLDTDGGQFLGGDNRIVNTPNQATITLPIERRIRSISIIMADSTETGSFVRIETVEYNLVRGTFHGGSTYTYTASIPDVLCQVIEFEFDPATANNWVIISGVNSIVLEVWEI